MNRDDKLIVTILGLQDATFAPRRRHDLDQRTGQNLHEAREAFVQSGLSWQPEGATEIQRQAERRLVETAASVGLVDVRATVRHVIRVSLPDPTEQWGRALVGMPSLVESRLALAVLSDLVAPGCWACETCVVNGDCRQGYGDLGPDEGRLLGVVEDEFLPLLARGLVRTNSDGEGRAFYSPTDSAPAWIEGPLFSIPAGAGPEPDDDAIETYFAARAARRRSLRTDLPPDRNQIGPPFGPTFTCPGGSAKSWTCAPCLTGHRTCSACRGCICTKRRFRTSLRGLPTSPSRRSLKHPRPGRLPNCGVATCGDGSRDSPTRLIFRPRSLFAAFHFSTRRATGTTLRRIRQMAATEFQRAVNEWKRTRDEWKRLTAAIKRGAETAELLELLPDAGCSNEEANALINLRRRATRPATAKDAKRFAVAEKAVAKLDEEIAALEKRRGLSKTSFERDELDSQIFDLAEKRQRANQDLATCRVAAAHIETATAAGVI